MVIVRLAGGMGNQMFEYAVGRSLAIKNNTTLGLDLAFLLDRTPIPHFTFRDYDLDVFNIDAAIVSRKDVPALYRKYHLGWAMRYVDFIRRKFISQPGKEKMPNTFDHSVMELGPNIYLEGWWQTPKYFEEYQEVIRNDFTLKAPLSEKSQQLAEEIKNAVSACIHVRRGDYVGNAFHDVGLGESYYKEGLAYISSKVDVEKIYVFSDDIEWCKNNLHFDIETMFVGPEYAGKKGEEHVMLMSMCKHFIIPNSSFAWWGAWLSAASEKIVIAPKRWFADASIDTTDLIPAQWIRI
jgi:hypothetical protein